MRWKRHLSACALAVVLLQTLTSCSRPTPLCDYADGLVKNADLAAAADAYATAERSSEGDCAEDGLDHVGELQAKARAEVAKGRAAARAGDTAAAEAAFKAATSIDRSDDAAAAELERLSGAAPTPEPSVSTVVLTTPAPRTSGAGLAWFALAIAVLATAATAAMWLLFRRRLAEVHDGFVMLTNQHRELTEQHRDLGSRHEMLTGRIADNQKVAQDAVDEVRNTIEEVSRGFMRLLRSSLQMLDDDARRGEVYVPKPEEKP